MVRVFCLFVALGLVPASVTSAADPAPVRIVLTVPADATVAVDGVLVKQTGAERRLLTPPIAAGEKGKYTVKVTFAKDGKPVTIERDILVEGGKETRADFTKEAAKQTELATKTDDAPKKDEPKKEASTPAPKSDEPKKPVRLDVPYVSTPENVVDEMLKLAGVTDGDVVYDLGCGDGRIVVTAAKSFKAKRGIGIDIDPERIKEARQAAKDAKVENKVEFLEGDILKIKDLSDASVVTLYLLPDINDKIKPVLRKTLKPGARVVSHDFDMGEDWKPEKELVVKDKEGREHTLYLWTIVDKPAELKKDEAPKKDEPTIKVPYVPTPQNVVEEMLKVAGVKEGDVVYDLGCGDGRIVITAVKKFNAKKGYGVDIDPERVKESKQAAKDAKVEDKVEFREGDVLKITDVSEATVVCLYLFPEVNERLAPMLRRTLKPGSRVVSHDFLMGDDWKPEKEVRVKDDKGDEHSVYLWTIREKK